MTRSSSVWLLLRGCAGLGLLALNSRAALGQTALHITPPVPLNTNAATDEGGDLVPQVVTDGRGVWLVAWVSYDSLDGTIGEDADLLYARSVDNGTTWSDPRPLNTNAATDTGGDYAVWGPQLAADGQGHWVVVWSSTDDLAGSIGNDRDILFARSDDHGVSWTTPRPLNPEAHLDDRDADHFPRLSTDGQGNWIAVWASQVTLGDTIGRDHDLLFVRSTDNGSSWTAPLPLNSNAAHDGEGEVIGHVVPNGHGEWAAVWSTGPFILDRVVVARSSDDGATWSEEQLIYPGFAGQLATDAEGTWLLAGWHHGEDTEGCSSGTAVWYSSGVDLGRSWSDPTTVFSTEFPHTCSPGGDSTPRLATDRLGMWVLAWTTDNSLGETIGDDRDALMVVSSDNGATWTIPSVINGNAAHDLGDDRHVDIATDGRGHWIAVWTSDDDLAGAIGSDDDILVARFAWPDCNANAVPDHEDIAAGISDDENANGIPDECEGLNGAAPGDPGNGGGEPGGGGNGEPEDGGDEPVDDGNRGQPDDVSRPDELDGDDGETNEPGNGGGDGEPSAPAQDPTHVDGIPSRVCPMAALAMIATGLTGIWIARRRPGE